MPLVKYTGSNTAGLVNVGKEREIFVDVDFVAFMDIMNDSAKEHGLRIVVVDAKRESIVVPGAIVTPAKMSNHLVGGAVDINVIEIAAYKYYNSARLQICTGPCRDFINEVKGKGLRWGGDFNTKDPVHFDAGWNVNNPDLYHAKYKEYFG